VKGATSEVLEFAVNAGTNYLIENRDDIGANKKFAPVMGTPASSAKKLGPVQIGLFPTRD